ncbi:MAG TPA: LTA synthase family protein, partial [Bacteroidales bacterium]|nr:LTA synthase family protein [Bacteroidales bacterium]
LVHPQEIYKSVPALMFWSMIIALIIINILLFLFYKKFFYRNVLKIKHNIFFSLLFFIIMPIIFIIGIRGGLQQIPINQSEAYFSEHQILNNAAVNSGWNLIYSISHNINNINKNPFTTFPKEYTDDLIKKIYTTNGDSTIKILTTNRPNIFMFILEGWSGDVIKSLGGYDSITPYFSEIEKEGILFTNIYSSGQRSQQGIACIFSGFPAHPINVVTHHQDKFSKLPSLSEKLYKNGYFNLFYYGGQLIYGNIKSYLSYFNFNKIIEGKDFNASIPRGKLGIHDNFVLDKIFYDIQSIKQPFFLTFFTLSSHSPYDYPYSKKIKKFAIENDYINAINFSDMCIGKFYKAVKKEKWFNNTLFIFISDHSHGSPKNWGIYSPEYHKIVFMLAGPTIKREYQGTKISKIGSQVDLAATLLPQLNIDASEFKWSKNLLNFKSPEFAFYAYEEGFGWVRPYGYSVYENRFDRFHYFYIDPAFIDKKDSLTIEGKCYLQKVFQEYMDL